MAEAKKNRYGTGEDVKAGSDFNPFKAPAVHEGVDFVGFEMKEWKEGEPKVMQFTFTKVDTFGDKETLQQTYWPVNEDKVDEIARKAWASMEAKGTNYKGKPDTIEEFIEQRIDEAYDNFNYGVKHILSKILPEEQSVIKPKGKNDAEVYQNMGLEIEKRIADFAVADRQYNLKVIKDYRGYSVLPERGNFIEIHVPGKPTRLQITANEAKTGQAANSTASKERDADTQANKAADTSF